MKDGRWDSLASIFAGIFAVGCTGISCLGQIGITIFGLLVIIALFRSC